MKGGVLHSVVVHASQEGPLSEKYPVWLDRGMNAFVVLIRDTDEFLLLLREKGATVHQLNRLDDTHDVVPETEATKDS